MGRISYSDSFEWDDNNEEKIATKHHVDRYEAEGAARDLGAISRRDGDDRYGNPRYLYIGKTEEGRILFLVIVRKEQRLWRVGSARNASFSEKKIYRRRNQ